MSRHPLSVVLITKDAQEVLAPCLQSVPLADEILVVDSGSTDGTLELARLYHARIIHQPWLGFGRQKQFAVSQAKHDWVLCLDADERVSPELMAEIETLLQHPHFMAYSMPRRNRFLNQWLNHGEGYPDRILRLFHRRHATWSTDPIHEKVETRLPVGRLKGDLMHESQQSLEAYLDKQNRYTTLQAQEIFRSGNTISTWKIVFSPLARFLKFYFLRLGFLDGLPGLIHISLGVFNSFIKYAKVRELQAASGRPHHGKIEQIPQAMGKDPRPKAEALLPTPAKKERGKKDTQHLHMTSNQNMGQGKDQGGDKIGLGKAQKGHPETGESQEPGLEPTTKGHLLQHRIEQGIPQDDPTLLG